ncbi:MAG: hypothetical protein JO044_13320 [Mycobacteriaceae bacterium]|nr:hypothetical protein [Mycobacteriaceae bacterium]
MGRALHVELAVAAGAGRSEIHAVLLLVAEYGIAKAWRAHRALHHVAVTDNQKGSTLS